MAFKMKNPSIAKMVKAAGDSRVAMKMKAEEAAAMKMKKAAMKLERDAAMKKYVSDAQRKAVHASKAESAMKAAKPDYIDIDGDGNKTESMKQAAADKKSGMKMKKSPAKMGHSPKKMKKSAMKLKKGKGTKKVDMPDFASTKQVKAKTGGNAKTAKSDIKSPAKLRKPKQKRPKDKKDHMEILREKGVLPKDRRKGSAMKLEGDPKKGSKNSTSVAKNLLQNLENYGTQEEKDRITKYLNLGDTQAYLNPNEEVGQSAGGSKRQAQIIAQDASMRASSARSAEKREQRKKDAEARKAETARKNAMSKSERRKEERRNKKNK